MANSNNASTAAVTNAAVSPTDPTLQTEVSFINGLTPTGTVITDPTKAFWEFSGGETARKWGTPTAGTPGGTVTYFFDPTSNFTPQEQATILECFALWSAETNITFAVAPTQASANVLLHRGTQGSGEFFTSQVGLAPGSGTTLSSYQQQTLINFDSSTFGFELTGNFGTVGGYGIGSIVHEMGHMIGLGHAGPYNGTVDSSTQQYTPYDSRLWSIMSYIDPQDTNAKDFAQYPVKGTNWGTATDGTNIQVSTTPMPLDILAAQQLYGAPVNTPLSGNNVFGFNCNIVGPVESFFDFTKNTHPVVTLFDTGTGNTLDLSGYTQAATVDLEGGSFSSVGGQVNNIGIAFGTKIDTVVCGGAGNTLTDNGDGDTFEGAFSTFAGDTVTNFSFGDTLYVTNATPATISLAYTGGILTLTDNAAGQTGTDTITLSNDPTGTFVEQADAQGGVDVTLAKAGAVTISGTVAGQTTTPAAAPIAPFAGVKITDTNSPTANETLTVTVSGAGGTLSSLGTATNDVYTVTGTAAVVTAALDAAKFTPAALGANVASSVTTFTLTDTSSAGAGAGATATDATTTVVDTNPALKAAVPTISNTVAGQTTTSDTPLDPFSTVVVADSNAGATDTLTITLTGAGGMLNGTGFDLMKTDPAKGIYVLSGSAATITTELQQLVFTPTAGAAGTSSTTTFSLSDTSSAGATSKTDAKTTVIDTDPKKAPTIAGTLTGQNTTSEAPISPFATAVVTDPNGGATDVLTITLKGGGGTLAGTGLNGTGNIYSLAGTAAQITTELQKLVFTPTKPTPNGKKLTTATTTFNLSDVSSAGVASAVDSKTTVIDNDPAVGAVNPIISGTVAGQTTAEDTPIDPFLKTTIADGNAGATDTLTIRLGGSGGTLTDGTGFTGLKQTAVGVYTLSKLSPAALTTELQNLIFTPTPAVGAIATTTFRTTFTLDDKSSAGTGATDATTSVIDSDVTGTADNPVIAGTKPGQTTTSEAPIAPFATVTITDPNVGATDALTISVTGAGGTLADGAGFTGLTAVTGQPGVYTIATTNAAALTKELDALVFTPTKGAPGTQSTTFFTLADLSSANTLATDNLTSVIDIDPAGTAKTPTITGTKPGQTTTSEAPVTPFSTVLITDPNVGATDQLTISLTGTGGTLVDGTGFNGLTPVTGQPGVYTLAATTAAAITAELDALVFTPTKGAPGTRNTTTFTLTDVTSVNTQVTNTQTTVIDVDPTGTSKNPTITGTKAGQTTTSETPISAFATVTVKDPNAGATDTLTISLTGAGGTLADGAGFTGLTPVTGQPGVYRIAATNAAALTQELDALVFTPAKGAPGTRNTTSFTLTDVTSVGTQATNNLTTVIDVDPAGRGKNPTITGTKAGQTTTSEAPLSPFATVTITDPNVGATDTLTISVTGAGGTLADGAGFTGLTPVAGQPGIYRIAAANAAALTNELQALVFTPAKGAPGTQNTTSFTLTDVTSAGTQATNNATTVIDIDPTTKTGKPTVAINTGVTFNPAGAATITGTDSDTGGTVTSVQVFDGTKSLGFATLGPNGTWTLANVLLSNCTHSISAIATDSTGQTSPQTKAPFTLTTGIQGKPYTTDEEDFNPSGLLTGQTFTDGHGTVYATDTVTTLPNGFREVDYTSGSYFNTQAFFERTDVYTANYQTLEVETLYNKDGTHWITGHQNNLTINSIQNDRITGGGFSETFVFTPGFGQDSITDFHVTGTGHDVLSLATSEFTSLAAMINNNEIQQQGANTVIHAPNSTDTITLANVNATTLRAQKNDFTFHA